MEDSEVKRVKKHARRANEVVQQRDEISKLAFYHNFILERNKVYYVHRK